MVAGILVLGAFILAICTLVENPMYNLTFIAQYEGDTVSFFNGVVNFAGEEKLLELARAVLAEDADVDQIRQSEQYGRIYDFLEAFLNSGHPGRTAEGLYTDCQILIFDQIPETDMLPTDWRENATVLFDVGAESQVAGEQARFPSGEEEDLKNYGMAETYNMTEDDGLGTPYYHIWWDYSPWTGGGDLEVRVIWFHELEKEGLCLAFTAHSSLILHRDVVLIQFFFAAMSGVVIIIVIIIALLVNRKTIIRPILQVAREAERFGKDSTQVSEKLEEIKTGDEIQLLSQNLLQLEKDVIRYVDDITRATAERERIGAELDLATSIQADMLPHIFSFPGYNDFELYTSMTPAKEVGGDFYDFFLVGQDHLAMVMADALRLQSRDGLCHGAGGCGKGAAVCGDHLCR